MYKTNDFYVAAVLRSLGYKFKTELHANTDKVTFIFDREVEEIVHKYWDNELQVDAKKLVAAIKEMKSRIHELL